MKNKKILLVGKETFMYPFYFLIDRWKKDNTIATFWINPVETNYDECDINSSTYYKFLKKDLYNNYTLNNAADIFTQNIEHPNIDYDYLDYIENEYSFFKNVNIQLIADQKMTGHYHFRNMCAPIRYEQQLLWLQLVYKDIEKIIDDYKPDVILDCDIAELGRTVLNEVAHKNNIPYISIAYPRFETYKIPSYSLNIGIENYFYEEYLKCLNLDNEAEIKYIKDFQEKSTIKNQSFMVSNNATYKYEADSLLTILKSVYSRFLYFKRQDKSKKNRLLKQKNPILYDSSNEYMKFWVRYQFYRRKLMKSKSFFDEPVEGEKYVYMPLHLIPESTTFSLAPLWINELSAIEAVSKSIPAGWWLYVKEHQAMLGERGEEFYIKVRKIPNVRLVRFNYYDDPKPWIEKSQAVVTITGTSAFEAALLGKPAFVFGDVPFGVIKGVKKICDIKELPSLFKNLQKQDNIKEVASYIRAVKNVGQPINLNYIMNEAYLSLVSGKELDSNFEVELDRLAVFFENAYDRFLEENK